MPRRKSKYQALKPQTSVNPDRWEMAESHLHNKIFVLKCIYGEGKDLLVWGYDIFNEQREFLGTFNNINTKGVEIQAIQTDLEGDAFWIMFDTARDYNNQLHDKQTLRIY